eukprot:3721109-Pyramimonas_sp.AAC.1
MVPKRGSGMHGSFLYEFVRCHFEDTAASSSGNLALPMLDTLYVQEFKARSAGGVLGCPGGSDEDL